MTENQNKQLLTIALCNLGLFSNCIQETLANVIARNETQIFYRKQRFVQNDSSVSLLILTRVLLVLSDQILGVLRG